MTEEITTHWRVTEAGALESPTFKKILQGKASSAISIASGQLSLSTYPRGWVVVSAEIGTSDILTNVAPMDDGDVVILTPAAGHTIIMSDGAIQTLDGETHRMQEGDWTMLAYSFTEGLKEILRSAPVGAAVNAQTGTSYTAVLSDRGKLVTMTNAAANTFTVPPDSSVSLPTGTIIYVGQYGAGQTELVAGSGVTIRVAASKGLKIAEQYEIVMLVKKAANEWVASGALIA